MDMKIKIDFGSISVKPIKVEPYLAKRLISVVDLWWNSVPGGTKRYYGTRGWQRSCRNHAVKAGSAMQNEKRPAGIATKAANKTF